MSTGDSSKDSPEALHYKHLAGELAMKEIDMLALGLGRAALRTYDALEVGTCVFAELRDEEHPEKKSRSVLLLLSGDIPDDLIHNLNDHVHGLLQDFATDSPGKTFKNMTDHGDAT
jgi:hypothetical protein